VMRRVPAEKLLANFDFDKAAAKLLTDFKAMLMATDGYGQLYVTSFACGSNEDEDKRGILTLWDRYTQHMGYCVQFEHEDVRRLLRLECDIYNYFSANLVRVRYGLDR
jgi:hypothetical protein